MRKLRFGHCITYDTGNSVGEISGHSSAINSVSIRPIRPYRAATASDDQTTIFYHGPPFKFNSQMRDQHTNFVHGVAFSPNGEHLVSVGSDKKILLSDGKTGEFRRQIGAGEHTGSIFSVSWATDSRSFVTASADQTVRVWDVETEKVKTMWKLGDASGDTVPHQQVGVVWPTRSDGTIISLSLGGNLNYFTEKEEKPYRVVSGHQKSITSLAVAEEGKTLFTGSYEGRVCSWDVVLGEATAVLGASHTNQVTGMEVVERKMLSVGWDDTLKELDISSLSLRYFMLEYIGPNGLTLLTEGK